ncbi:CDP-alcohol phosphatidyltransferase family protein [Clostridium sp. CX1]|uniref:CDP-alcohol phosphatidyltransferase family protein n=1 Tax=Clostridium tanneri TaxID=3037988 RepID=A0ABU4JUP3_9CLOT|nr:MULTISPECIES: CDP-alcohol phosphatidyltransferase family protein [unclassified Clostridium]MCT8976649.1 CDP-alcohol phosphatidyltransferase family protein [Clostridium sp. CX1]MDW8801862.1 CDP-alcohol phosphatidyltransferase family protein [Clostridium sp. A1-XYC3]
MKSIPNIISILRILLSLILLFLKPFNLLFFIVYSICGFSDIIDGYIARKTNSASGLGAILDSIADIVFMGAVIVAILPTIFVPMRIFIWIILIAFVRIVSLLVAYCKYHTLAILHTYANKATGFLLFCYPYLYNTVDISILWCLICTVATLSAIEELIIHITSKELSRNVIGIFIHKRSI